MGSYLQAGAQKFTPGKDDPATRVRQEHHRCLPRQAGRALSVAVAWVDAGGSICKVAEAVCRCTAAASPPISRKTSIMHSEVLVTLSPGQEFRLI